MIEIVNVSSKGQIVIPERVRKKHKIEKGDRLIIIDTGDNIYLKKEKEIENKMIEYAKMDSDVYSGMLIAEKSLAKDWNSKEDEIWDKY
ncbi:MAG: AbrB/MazE/SpoVT family DNA-binding domain-containing protein [Nanoarchaeota archaeon]|nr:AbrB/MazE/SpoVT family DNA-binding domain-containing protein [Nanoarchaeota archaeon]